MTVSTYLFSDYKVIIQNTCSYRNDNIKQIITFIFYTMILCKLNNNLNVFDVIIENTYKGERTVESVTVNKNFNNYRWITFIAIWDESQWVDSITLPYYAFLASAGGAIYLRNDASKIEIRYESDSSFKMKCDSTYLALRIYGCN